MAHSKYKNTGILFELLIRQITNDTLNESDSKAISLVKKYFTKTELGKEYKLYEHISKNKNLTEGKSEIVIQTILESAKNLNKTNLKKQKYNLIKEIKENYDIEKFFRTKLPNYKVYAALYNLMEGNLSTDKSIDNKVTLLEHLSKPVSEEKDDLYEEIKAQDKDIRILSYRLLLEKFNEKYDTLSKNQKIVLKEYVNNIDNNLKLKEFYNSSVGDIKNEIKLIKEDISDKTLIIKLNEVSNLLVEVKKNETIKNDSLVDLLQYYDLIDELKKV